MKKIIISVLAVLLLLAPTAVFAGDGLWVGPTALYNMGMTFDELIENPDVELNPENFSYGVEARLDLSIFQASINAIYYPNFYIFNFGAGEFMDLGEAVESTMNVGVYADLGIVGLGLSAGPRMMTFIGSDIEDSESFEIGSNVKLEADLILGSTLFSAYYIGYVDDLEEWADSEDPLGDLYGKAGLSLLFQL